MKGKYEEILHQIQKNIPYDTKGKPYSKKEITRLLSFLSEQERYEECILVNKFIWSRFDHENNYLVR